MPKNHNFEVRNEEIEQKLRLIGSMIGSQLPKGWAFNLVIASVGEKGSTFYISNIEREDSIKLLQEFIDKQAGEGDGNSGSTQKA